MKIMYNNALSAIFFFFKNERIIMQITPDQEYISVWPNTVLLLHYVYTLCICLSLSSSPFFITFFPSLFPSHQSLFSYFLSVVRICFSVSILPIFTFSPSFSFPYFLPLFSPFNFPNLCFSFHFLFLPIPFAFIPFLPMNFTPAHIWLIIDNIL